MFFLGVRPAYSLLFDCFENFLKQRHSEKQKVCSESKREMLKQVQHDTIQLFNFSTFKRAFAFTLAETLIVMGIIGVVAALTLPNLNSSTANKEKVVKLQKIYQNLNDAYGRATVVYGPTEDWCSGLTEDNCQKRFFERLTEFMKISKVCTISDGCSVKFGANHPYSGGGPTSKYAVILADGTTLSLRTDSHKTTDGYAVFDIDIDGINKGSDKYCYDTFELDLNPTKKGIVYYAYNKEGEKVVTSTRAYCTAWILEYGNMDYLKCNNDLKFGGKISCK